MPSLDDKMLREIIMDHYQYPRNKRTMNETKYDSIHMDSESCTDDIHVYLWYENGIIKDVAFDGIACTIATSSTSIMTELLKGKTKDEAKKIIDNYMNMIYEKQYDEELLEEANAFKYTYRQANRINCATIGWKGINELLDRKE